MFKPLSTRVRKFGDRKARRAAAWCALSLAASGLLRGDWTTYGHDPARSGWAQEETSLNPRTASTLKLQWKAHVENESYSLTALTAPVVATRKRADGAAVSVVYVAGVGGTVFALDGQTGAILWKKALRSMALPGKGGFQGSFLCPNGITATPVVDEERNRLYVISSDGSLYGLDLDTGNASYGPVPFVAPFAKSWSLNLVNGTVYTSVSLGCGNGRAGVYAADVRDVRRPQLRALFLSKAYTAGIWGRGGVSIGDNGLLYGGTADGDTDPVHGDYSNTVVSATLSDLSVHDYFLPRNYQQLKKSDMDVGSASPVWFEWKGRHLLAHGSKEGVVYLFDADHLGSSDHQTPLYTSPRLGNDRAECCAASGIWGSLGFSRDKDGNSWLYVPLGGPPSAQGPKFPLSNGDNPHGSIMAFKVVSDRRTDAPALEPAWISTDFYYPDPPVIANGVVFALSNGENPDQRGDESKRFSNTRPAVLKALDAQTGKLLFESGSSISTWVHFSGLAISGGQIFAVDHDSNVYSFAPGGTAERKNPLQLASGDSSPDALNSSWIGRVERSDEYRLSWLKRIGGTSLLVLLTAAAASWLQSRNARTRGA